MSRFAVGIDLGTTHCVLAYRQLQEDADQIQQQLLNIPQLIAPGQVEQKPHLGSFLFVPHEAQFNPEQLSLPWYQDYPITGKMARDLGSKTPNRLISSAKSWLCHGQVDRRSAILPVDAAEGMQQLSPFEASKQYLQHLLNAWQQQFPEDALADQQLVITVPASFDPSARDLTLDAAKALGLYNATLLEEPQAALYSWLASNDHDWREQVSVGDVILVVDVGGGTTDLSLIAVTEQEGNLELTRVAVGDHLLLGGDNMDITLAHVLAQKLAKQGNRLQPWQINGLAHACRDAKETLLANNDVQQVPLVVPSRGSSLMGGSLRTELTRDEVQQVLLEGFFPQVPSNAELQRKGRSALSTVSLPYEQDPAITRHLANFLTRQRHAASDLGAITLPDYASFLHPTAVLFNGGVSNADKVVERITTVLNQWLGQEQAQTVKVLQGTHMDQAVAMGASYYAQVRQGDGVRIRGGIAAAYYVGIESAMPAIPGFEAPLEACCVAPFGMEEGSSSDLFEQRFSLLVGEPVQFKFFESKVRREDSAGQVLDFWQEDELQPLPDIEVTLMPGEHHQAGQAVAVLLQAHINELGTLELNALEDNGNGQWQVSFDTRSVEATDY